MVMFRFTLQSIHLNLPLNIFLNPDTTPIKSIDDYEMDQLLGLFHSENDDDLLNVNLQMFQAWLVIPPSSKFYIVYNVLFHKDGGAKFAATNVMSCFYIFVPTKVTIKLDNRNTGRAQWIGIVLCCFTNCPIICPVVPVCYFSDSPSNTISLGALKFYVGFQKVTSKPIEYCDFISTQGCSWILPYQTQNNLDCI